MNNNLKSNIINLRILKLATHDIFQPLANYNDCKKVGLMKKDDYHKNHDRLLVIKNMKTYKGG